MQLRNASRRALGLLLSAVMTAGMCVPAFAAGLDDRPQGEPGAAAGDLTSFDGSVIDAIASDMNNTGFDGVFCETGLDAQEFETEPMDLIMGEDIESETDLQPLRVPFRAPGVSTMSLDDGVMPMAETGTVLSAATDTLTVNSKIDDQVTTTLPGYAVVRNLYADSNGQYTYRLLTYSELSFTSYTIPVDGANQGGSPLTILGYEWASVFFAPLCKEKSTGTLLAPVSFKMTTGGTAVVTATDGAAYGAAGVDGYLAKQTVAGEGTFTLSGSDGQANINNWANIVLRATDNIDEVSSVPIRDPNRAIVLNKIADDKLSAGVSGYMCVRNPVADADGNYTYRLKSYNDISIGYRIQPIDGYQTRTDSGATMVLGYRASSAYMSPAILDKTTKEDLWMSGVTFTYTSNASVSEADGADYGFPGTKGWFVNQVSVGEDSFKLSGKNNGTTINWNAVTIRAVASIDDVEYVPIRRTLGTVSVDKIVDSKIRTTVTDKMLVRTLMPDAASKEYTYYLADVSKLAVNYVVAAGEYENVAYDADKNIVGTATGTGSLTVVPTLVTPEQPGGTLGDSVRVYPSQAVLTPSMANFEQIDGSELGYPGLVAFKTNLTGAGDAVLNLTGKTDQANLTWPAVKLNVAALPETDGTVHFDGNGHGTVNADKATWTGKASEEIVFPTGDDMTGMDPWTWVTGWALADGTLIDMSKPATGSDAGLTLDGGDVTLYAQYSPLAQFGFKCDDADENRVVTAYRGQTISISAIIRGDLASFSCQSVIPYDEEDHVVFADAKCDGSSNSGFQYDIGKDAVNAVRLSMKLRDTGTVLTNFKLTVLDNAPAGDYVLQHRDTIVIYKDSEGDHRAYTDTSETLTIRVLDKTPITLPEGDGYVYDGEKGGPFANEDYHGRIEPYHPAFYDYEISYSNPDTGKTDETVAYEATTGRFMIPGADVTANLVITVAKTAAGTMEYKAYSAGVAIAIWHQNTLYMPPDGDGGAFSDDFVTNQSDAAESMNITYQGRPMAYIDAYGGWATLLVCSSSELKALQDAADSGIWKIDTMFEFETTPAVTISSDVSADINQDGTVNIYDSGYLMNVFRGGQSLVSTLITPDLTIFANYFRCDLDRNGVVDSRDFIRWEVLRG